MAIEVKISQLPSAAAITGVEKFPAVQSGGTVAPTLAQVRTYTDVTASGFAATAQATAIATASGYAVDSLNTAIIIASGYAGDALTTAIATASGYTESYTNGEIATLSGYVDDRLAPIEDFKEYDAARTYALNDPTFYAGVPYKSLSVGNIGHQPDTSPTYWEVTGGGSGIASVPGVNYDNGQFENKLILGYATYADAAQATPVDGTGGTATLIAFTRDSTTPLIGNGSGLITKATNSAQGEGVSYDFTIDRGLLHEVAKVEFQYEASSLYADGYVGVFLYDKTNASLIPLSVQDVPASYGKPGTFLATFIPSTSTEYRLIFHVATDTTTEWTMMIDNVVVGNKDIAVGAAISEWQSYTPTFSAGWGTCKNVNVKYRRVGSSLEVEGTLVTGTVASSVGTITLPPGLTHNLTSNQPVGGGWRNTDTSNDIKELTLIANGIDNKDKVYLCRQEYSFSYGPFAISYNVSALMNSAQEIKIQFTLPISQWTSNINLATDFQEFAFNTESVVNTNDTDSFGYGEGGTPILANTAATYYDVKTLRPWQSTDIPILEVRSKVDGTWHNVEQAFVPSLFCHLKGQTHTDPGSASSGRIAGASVAKVTSQIHRVFFFVSCVGTTDLAASSTPIARAWSAIIAAADGFDRWRVRKVSNGNMAEIPPVVFARCDDDTVYTTAVGTILRFDNKREDTHNAVTTGASWKFTAPISGLYNINVVSHFGSNTTCSIYIGVVKFRPIIEQMLTTSGYAIGGAVIRLAAGQYIDIRPTTTSGNNNQSRFIEIARIGS